MSPRAAWRLEELGFAAVYDYVAGEADWTAAGLPTEGQHRRDALPPYITTHIVTAQPEEPLGQPLSHAAALGAEIIVAVNAAGIVLGRIRTSTITADPNQRVGDVMHDGPATVRVDENPHDLLQRMRNRAVKDVIVTDPDGHLVGIIRRADLERPATSQT
jgi:predicted transcriptional regulator